jgi:hypothetical protein
MEVNMFHRALAVLAIASALTVSNAHAQFLQPDFVFTFATPNTRVDVAQFVTKGIVGPDRVETVGIVICASRALQVRFSTTSTAGIAQAHGVGLAAILGFMQGRSADDIVKIVGPDMPVSIVVSNLQLLKGAFEIEHVQAVADQLAAGVEHIALDTPPSLVNAELAAFQTASADLGASAKCP